MESRRPFKPERQLLIRRVERNDDRTDDSRENGDEDDCSADLRHSYRIRGSRTPYSMSVRRFTPTYVRAIRRMQPWTSG